MRLLKRFSERRLKYSPKTLSLRINAVETALAVLLRDDFAISEENAFNGQTGRKEIFKDITSNHDIDLIVETGTFLGNTTAYMATTSGIEVITVEANNLFFLIAQKKLSHLRNVSVVHSDSADYMLGEANTSLANRSTFFYLDAHWGKRLPLIPELESIFSHYVNYVVMIDDFRVEGDHGYTYDRYGMFNHLTIKLIKKLLAKYQINAFFPALDSARETGARRGCIILAPKHIAGISDKLVQYIY